MEKRKTGKEKIFVVSLYIIFLLLQILVISKKANYHIDETLSYGLSSYTKGYFIALEEGHRYEPARDPFIEYLSVQPGNRRNFIATWANQANDSHPPFYYALVHLVGAFDVGVFSKWHAGMINIFFSLATLFIIRRMMDLLSEDKNLKNIISIGFILNYGILSDSAFFRMYFMAMFFVSLTTYLILLQVKKDRKLFFYIPIILIVYAGTLTHYYCLLFDIFISVVYCIYLLFEKKWKDVALYCMSMGVAAAITIATFPSIIRHLFSTGHAQDAAEGIKSPSEFIEKMTVCFKQIDHMLFGRLLLLFLVMIIGLSVYFAVNKKKKVDKQYIIAALPTLMYFVTISITATYTNERYFTPIFAVLYVLIFTILLSDINLLCGFKKMSRYIGIGIVALSIALSYVGSEWPYLYLDDVEYLSKAEKYKDSDCICIHNDYRLGWEIQLNFNEFIKYNSFILFDQREIEVEKLNDYIQTKNVVINLTCVDDKEEYIKRIIDALPQYSSYEEIGGNGNGISYYLY